MQPAVPDATEATSEITVDGAGSAPHVAVHIPMCVPRFWSAGFTVGFVALVAFTSGSYAALFGGPEPLADALYGGVFVGAFAVLCLALLAWRTFLRPRVIAPMAFFDTHMTAPKRPGSKHTLRVDYDDILSVDLRGRGSGERLCIGTPDLLLTYPRPSFERPDAVERALKELYVRILRLPQGAVIAERIAQRRRLAIATLMSPAAATHALLTLFGVLFGLAFLMGAVSRPLGLVRYGALVPEMVRQGEVFRLLAATFLHQSVLHLYINCLSLFFLGGMLERLLGWSRFLIIYFVAALGGALAILAWPSSLFSVGAMSGTAGLFGALITVQWTFRRQLPASFRQPLRLWVFVVALVLVVPVLTPGINPLAHLVGFALGVFMALLITDAERALDPAAPVRISLRIVGLALAAVNVVALMYTLNYAEGSGRNATLTLLRELARPEVVMDPQRRNEASWSTAVDPLASTDELTASVAVAQLAQGELPHSSAIADTVAALHYRLGDMRQALELQRPLLNQGYSLYAMHFGQFLRGHYAKHGVWLTGAANAKGFVVHPQADGPTLEVPKDARASVAYVLFTREDQIVQLVKVIVGDNAAGSLALPKAEIATDVILAGLEEGCGGCASDAREVSAWPLAGVPKDLP